MTSSKIIEKEKLKILLLAPLPFYTERGSPIAVLQMLRVFSEKNNFLVDCLVYHLGTDISLPNVNIHRIPNLNFIKNIRVGFSAKKIICDFFFFFKALNLVRKNKYEVIHAVEESVFFAIIFKFLFKIPYIYDLDSSLAQQLVEKHPSFKIFNFFFNWLETRAIKGSLMALPVCNALAELCKAKGSPKILLIPDISELENPGLKSTGFLKKELSLDTDKKILLYVGNLEFYQGIDLLLESFSLVCKTNKFLDLVLIGGILQKRIKLYKNKCESLGIDNRTHFLGPRPFNQLAKYLAEADIIASPRISGNNTPMKIYPYLHSGKPVIATDIYSHNQILSNKEAYLAKPTSESFAEGIIKIINDENLAKSIGENGAALIEKNYTYKAHKKRLIEAYDWIEQVGLPDYVPKKKNFSDKMLLFLLVINHFIDDFLLVIDDFVRVIDDFIMKVDDFMVVKHLIVVKMNNFLMMIHNLI